MLAEFRVSNYRSFKDEQVLSLIAVSDESMGKNSVQMGNHRILKTAVVYGANASGKSNLIRAMACMKDIVENSDGYKPGEKIPVTPFLFDEKTINEPSTFEITFFIDGVRHQYGFSATADKICREWLLAWPKGREQRWFERDLSEPEPYFGPLLKGQNKSIWSKVTENSLFLTVAPQWNHEQLSKVYKWIIDQFRELPSKSKSTEITDSVLYDAKESNDSESLFSHLIDIVIKADFGIDDFDIDQINSDNVNFPKNIPEDRKNKILKSLAEHPWYRKSFSHCGGKYFLNFEEESEGTQRFYSFLGPLLESTVFGYTIFKDELEVNLHPLLTRTLLSSFSDYEDSDTCAQLIFTTHDTTLLDPDLFGRDQVWFTEKGKDGATQLYSLADYKDVRKGEPMQKRYLAGRYGAIPILERFDLVGTKK